MLKKNYSLEELIKFIKTINRSKKKIVHCHGVFDLLHIGHIHYFQEAKRLGDILIVTLTPDNDVNKGPFRPVFNENQRQEAIAALEAVDCVAINQWATAINTIKLLKPDVYVKGSDYENVNNDITGNIQKEKEAVELVGGKIHFTSTALHSSTQLINTFFSKLTDSQHDFITKIKTEHSYKDIVENLSLLSTQSFTVLGEAIIDRYITCDPLGKSGKDPILMMQEKNITNYSGGASIVANHISSFVKNVDYLTYLGDTNDQLKLIKQSLNKNVNLHYVKKTDSSTIIKTRYLEAYSKAKLFGTYQFNDQYLNQSQENELITMFQSLPSQPLIVVDYGHGLLTPAVVDFLEQQDQLKLCINTQLNAANKGFHTISKYKKAFLVCIHEGELRHEFRNKDASLERLVEQIANKNNFENIIITRGKYGSLGFNQTDGFSYCPAFSNNVVDRLGAGDTFLAFSSLCLASSFSLDLSMFIGNIAASYSVSQMGTGKSVPKDYVFKTVEALLK